MTGVIGTRRRGVTVSLVLGLIVALVGATPTTVHAAHQFPDVPGAHPFHTEISWLADEGITGGYADGSFRPAEDVTRQAIAAFLHRYAGAPAFPGTGQTFSDVPTSHPFFGQVSWLVDEDLAAGFSDGSFRPVAPVTRQAIAAFLYRMEGEPDAPTTTGDFSDVPPGHPFAAEIAWLADTGITTGYPDGSFRPAEPVTRQAAAAFLYRLEHLEDPPGAIAGTVTSDGQPLADAVVEVDELDVSATTGPDGVYELDGLPAGSYQVTASADEHLSATATGIEVAPGAITKLDLSLDRIAPDVTATLTGDTEVVDGDPAQYSSTIVNDGGSADEVEVSWQVLDDAGDPAEDAIVEWCYHEDGSSDGCGAWVAAPFPVETLPAGGEVDHLWRVAYPGPGDYELVLTVTDGDGDELASASVETTVAPGPGPDVTVTLTGDDEVPEGEPVLATSTIVNDGGFAPDVDVTWEVLDSAGDPVGGAVVEWCYDEDDSDDGCDDWVTAPYPDDALAGGYDRDLLWRVTVPGVGDHTFTVIATDGDGHELGSDTLAFHVLEEHEVTVEFRAADGGELSGPIELDTATPLELGVRVTNHNEVRDLDAGWWLGLEVEDFASADGLIIETCEGPGGPCTDVTDDTVAIETGDDRYVIQLRGEDADQAIAAGDHHLNNFRVSFAETGQFTGRVFVFDGE